MYPQRNAASPPKKCVFPAPPGLASCKQYSIWAPRLPLCPRTPFVQGAPHDQTTVFCTAVFRNKQNVAKSLVQGAPLDRIQDNTRENTKNRHPSFIYKTFLECTQDRLCFWQNVLKIVLFCRFSIWEILRNVSNQNQSGVFKCSFFFFLGGGHPRKFQTNRNQ